MISNGSSGPSATPRMSRRSVLTAGAATALAAGVGGCTIGAENTSNKSGGGAGSKTLTIAMWGNKPANDSVKQISAAFEKKHPGVKVNVKVASGDAWSTLFTTLLKSQEVDILADFAFGSGSWPPASTGIELSGHASLATSGQLMDLSGESFMQSYNQDLQKAAMGYEGKIYGLLAATYVHGFWYKKGLLSKYNLDVPDTYDDFMSTLKTLKANGMKSPIFLAGKTDRQWFAWTGIAEQMMMEGHDSSEVLQVGIAHAKAFWDGKENWDSDFYYKVADRYVPMMQYVEPLASGVDDAAALGQWVSKDDDYAFFLDGTYDGTAITQAKPDLDFGFFETPGSNMPGQNRPSLGLDLTWLVPTWAKNKDLALQWLEFFSEQENYDSWLKLTGASSTQSSGKIDLPWADWLNEHSADAFAGVTNVWVPAGAAPTAGGPDNTKMVPFGKQSVDAALKDAADNYTKAVQSAKK